MKPIRLSLLVLTLALALTACSNSGSQTYSPQGEPAGSPTAKVKELPPEPALSLSAPEEGAKLSSYLEVSPEHMTFPVSLEVRGERQGTYGKTEKKAVKLAGAWEGEKWVASSYLEPSTRYTVTATDAEGKTATATFSSKKVSLKKQTLPSLYPNGGTWGVGQPVQLNFDVAVADKEAFEERLTVKTVPEQAGSWHWVSDTQVRWRPKTYWQPGTKVTVKAALNSVPAGKGVFGQMDKKATFKIEKAARTAKVDMKSQTMTFFRDGKKVKTIAVSTGEVPKFTTRSGTKLVMSHHRKYTMNSGTIGIDPNAGDGYNLTVDYAMRLTNSGEFIHAAPWNSANFGRVGRSHGCTGMSVADARWASEFLIKGAPIEYTGTDRPTTVDNGFGDWNVSFKKYKKGSAL